MGLVKWFRERVCSAVLMSSVMSFQDVDCVRETLHDCDYDVDATIATLLQTLELSDGTHSECVCVCVCMCVHTYMCVCTCFCVCVCVQGLCTLCVYVYIHICMRVSVCTCVGICAYVCACVCVFSVYYVVTVFYFWQ